ncbi:MAG: MaoC family dehydratase N-terminal domain-containing protein [Chloroflexi bacterium]|nr:MaoC family dehydratase N-terminal domain-containing protein [Chloroflexota bacterium]
MPDSPDVLAEIHRILEASLGGPPATGEVAARDFHRFAFAVDDLNALYFDEAYAKANGLPGIIAPPLFALAATHEDVPLHRLQVDGIARSESQAAIYKHFKRVVAGGTEYEFFQPLRPGDRLTAERGVGQIFQKEGRSGTLTFVESISTWKNQRGEKVAVQRFTSIYRE